MFHSNNSKCVWLQAFHLHSNSSKLEWLLEFHHHSSNSKSEWLLECLHLSSNKSVWRLEFSNSKCNFPQECHHSSTRQCFSNKLQQQQRHSSNALRQVLILSKGSRSAFLQGFLQSSTRRC